MAKTARINRLSRWVYLSLVAVGFLPLSVTAQDGRESASPQLSPKRLLMDAVQEELKRTHGKVAMEFTIENPMEEEFRVDAFLAEAKQVDRIVYQWKDIRYRCDIYGNDQLIRTIIHDGIYTDLGDGTVFTEDFVDALTFDDDMPDEALYLDGTRYVSYIDTHLFSLTMKDRITRLYDSMRFEFSDDPKPDRNEIAVNAYPKVSDPSRLAFYWPYRFSAHEPHDLTSSGYNSGNEMVSNTVFTDYFESGGSRLPATCDSYFMNTILWSSRLLPEECDLSFIPDGSLFIVDTEGKKIYGSPRWKNYTRYGATAIAIVVLGIGLRSLMGRKHTRDA